MTTHSLNRPLVLALLYISASLLALTPHLGTAQDTLDLTPPVAKVEVKTSTIHDTSLVDPYAWMRHKESTEMVNYLYAENGYAEGMMREHQLLQKKLLEEMRSRVQETYRSLPSKRDSYYYYYRSEADQDYGFLCRKKDSLTAPEEVYLNLNELAKEFYYFSLSFASLSPNHNLLAYGVDANGSRVARVYFKDVNGDSLLKDEIPACSGLTWAQDNKTVFYLVPDKKTKRNYQLYRHVLGTDPAKDELIYEEKDPTFNMGISRSSSREYIFLNTGNSKVSEVYYLDASQPKGTFKMVSPRSEKVSYSVNHAVDDAFYIMTDWEALNYRLLKTEIGSTSSSQWEEVIPHRESVLLQGYIQYKDHLVVLESEQAQSRIRVINRADNSEYELPLPDGTSDASAGPLNDIDIPKFRYSYSTMVSPSRVLEYDLLQKKDTLLQVDTVPNYQPELYESRRLLATAKDGKQIPMTIVYKKGMKPDGSNPTLLTSYGSYGAPTSPSFSSTRINYLDRGFIVALAHIRGGSDLGMQWYEDGKMLHKKNTFTDFIACAEHLVSEQYTSSDQLAISGSSAGGLLVGTVLNMRPELFQCAVAGVPFVDVINTMLDSTLPLTTFEYEEWGNPHIKKYFDYMLSYSPYDNVKAQDYPHLLVTAGYNDSQVGVWEPAKWVAKLRQTKTDNNRLLFKTSMQGGHQGVTGRYAIYKDLAFDMAFVMNALGIKEEYITVSGKVQDVNGNAMPFVNVYVDGTTNGTTTNFEGEFALDLKEDDLAELVFQSMGFQKHHERINMRTRTNNMTVVMQAEDQQLKQVTVTANAKDPAFAVMKQAIAKRKYHLNLVNSFTGDIYMKGTTRLNEIPDPEKLPKFLREGLPDSSDLGLLYLSESVARFHRKKPDNFKEEMLASKVAGYSTGVSWNRTSDVLFNFYENAIEFSDVSERNFVSPVSSTAMLFYKYKLLGTFYENDKLINKIEVIPRRKTDPIFHGVIYIVEDSWNIYGLDLFLTKDAQIDFADTIRVGQSFVQFNDSVWMPLSLKINYEYKIFGFDVTYNAVGLFSNYLINRSFPKKFFRNEVFRIEEGANKKDSLFWEQSRPVVLTEEERNNYHKSDSMEVVQKSDVYLDSIDAKSNKITLGNILISGYQHYKRKDSLSYSINPLISMIQYNTVEGVAFELRPSIRSWKNMKSTWLQSNLRYSQARDKFSGRASIFRRLDNKKFESIRAEGGHYISQFNNEREPISPLVNSIYTLLTEQNFMKIYEKTYGEIEYRKEVVNGFFVAAELAYASRSRLGNNSDFTIRDIDDREFTPNNPVELSTDPSRALIAEVNVAYRHKQRYEMYPNFKRIITPKYPTIYASYKKGVSTGFSDVDFDFVRVGLGDEVSLGLFGESRYEVTAGTFINTNELAFYDYQHFTGNQTMAMLFRSSWSLYGFGGQMRTFHTLEYYDKSTTSGFVEGHYEHHFNGFVLNKFPLLRKLRWQVVGGVNVLYTEDGNDFTELFVGIENIFKIFRIDFASSYESGGKLNPQVLIGFDI